MSETCFVDQSLGTEMERIERVVERRWTVDGGVDEERVGRGE